MPNVEDIYPLSPTQQGILFHSLYAAGAGQYIIQLRSTLSGKLNVALFERAWQEVIKRHTILRTSFAWRNLAEPLQIVHPQVALPFECHDWRALPPTEQERQLQELLQADRRRGFLLSQAPLMRISLIHMAEDMYSCIWTCHHLLVDGWSLNLVLEEVFALYRALCKGKYPLLSVPGRYRDYISWLRKQDQAMAEDYWKQALRGFASPTRLPNDRAAGSATDEQLAYNRLESILSPAVTAQLRTFVVQHRLTLNTVMQGAWALLLSRYSGDDDIVFGTTVSGRPTDLAHVNTMVGVFITTLPVRAQVQPTMPLLSWLQELQRRQVEQQQYEYSALTQIQRWSGVPNRLPLFESILAFENFPVQASSQLLPSDVQIRDVELVNYTNYPLDLDVLPGKELTLSFIYEQHRFTSEAIQRLLGNMDAILSSMVAQPEQPLAAIEILTPPERDYLINGINGTERAYPNDMKLIHQLFEHHAQAHPHRTAVVYREERLTFQELNERANRLAWYLVEQHVQPGAIVGLFLERSHYAVIAALAVFKAGGAYVPLDPGYPKERIVQMLEDSRPLLVFVQSSTQEMLPPLASTSLIVAIDTLDLSSYPPSNVPPRCTENDLAYLIYTSGTTGKPNGVLIEHNTYVRTCLNYIRGYQLTTFTPVSLNLGSISFDVFNGDMARSIFAGHTLVICPDDIRLEFSELYALMQKEGVNIFESVPMFINAFMEYVIQNHKTLDWFKVVISSSDAWRTVDYRRLKAQIGSGIRLINAYGATEATIDSTFYEETDGAPPPETPYVPIGRPFDNLKIYILDPQQKLVPQGGVGEIYIGGGCLARGYLHREALTKQRFLPDPFVKDGRMYKTGDLGRWLPDGNIEFLGRADYQVKLRGFRIELGEVETVLRQHPQVREAVIIAQDDAQGNKRLIAYVVLRQGAPVQANTLRAFVQERLPHYMVPAAYVTLDHIPLTSNGKIDRQALPLPDLRETAHAKIALPPRTATEKQIAQIWAEVLQLSSVGLYDNFFELGGHSILALRAISRLRETLGIDVPIRLLFDKPVLEALAAAIETLQSSEQVAPAEQLVPASTRDGPLPLSFAQQRLWILHELEPDSSAYNVRSAFRLSGHLDTIILERCFNDLLKRHESLRTTFVAADEEPQQVIASWQPYHIPLVDLQGLSTSEQKRTVQSLVSEEEETPFDLERGPLIRAKLFREGPQQHVFSVVLHHIITDDWSVRILFQEMLTLYGGFVSGAPAQLAPLPIQYADYAHWQRQWLQGLLLQQQLTYWRDHLHDAPAALALPTDHPRPARQTFRGAHYTFQVPAALTEALLQLGHEEQATLFMTLLAAFHVLLARYSNQQDVVVGTPIAQRALPQTQSIIGPLLNTLPMRARLSDTLSFRHLLAQVRATCLDAYAHQDLPFELLVEALQPVRDLSRNPLFQALFIFVEAPSVPLEVAGLQIEPLSNDSPSAMVDLTLSLTVGPEGLQGVWEYNTDLFERESIARLHQSWSRLLAGAVEQPDAPVGRLPLLGKEQIEELLYQWNATEGEKISAHLQQRFEAQVQRTPDAIALVSEELALSYQTLDTLANQLAHYLQRHFAVKRETPIGICLERSPAMVIGLLGILKAGCAYVPLDPDYPPSRLSYILENARAAVLLTRQELQQRLPGHQIPTICLDSDWSAICQEATETPQSAVDMANLAYIIFTSGSTGQPKGVQITHGAVANFLQSMSRHPGLTEQDTLLAVTSLSFDIAGLELFLPLILGARLVIASRDTAMDGKRLEMALALHDATVMQATPSTWRMLLDAGWQGKSNLRMLCGGEALPVELGRQLVGKGAALWNLYGPTETTIWSALFQVERVDRSIPIGRPIAHTQIYLLNPQLEPVPVGVAGELYIGGAGLSRGYLYLPELTAEKFIPNPFSDKPGERLYRTGDLACYRRDGVIEYLGRIDHQVKIRGFRIEPGEVEAALDRHPVVRESVVVAREDGSGDKRLVAYMVLDSSQQEENSLIPQLRAYLRERLPEYMVPSLFIMLDQFPLTPNGKIDRNALPTPGSVSPGADSISAPPGDEIEEILAGIWADVLHISQVGVHDNFFDLGGHSLLATRLIARVKSVFPIEVSLGDIFEAPTVAALAARIRGVGKGEQELASLPSSLVSRDQPLPLSFAQQRLWLLEQIESVGSAYHLSTAVRLRGQLNIAALQASIDEIMCRHEILRTSFALIQGQPMQIIAHFQPLPIPVMDLQALPQAEREPEAMRLIALETEQPFDLSHAPLLRICLLRLEPEVAIVSLTIHHIVSDAWSMNLLVREMFSLYQKAAGGIAAELPPLPIQYADYARWQRQWLQGDRLQQHLRYWHDQLRDAPAALTLPTDHPRPLRQSFRGAQHTFQIPASVMESLRLLGRQEQATLFMTLLASFHLLLARYSGQDDLVIGIPIAQRTLPQTQTLIGPLLNTLPIRARLSDGLSFRNLLAQVRARCLEAYAHQELPFELLVEAVQPVRDLSRNPLFQALFIFLEAPSPLELPGLELELLPNENPGAMLDLTLSLTQEPEGLHGVLEYNSDLFEPDSILRLQQSWGTLLAAVVAQPDWPISRLPLLGEAQATEILQRWNATEAPLPVGTLIDCFAAQVQHSPDAIALVWEEQMLTYQMLDQRANQIASVLRRHGIGQESLVGLYLERSAELLIGMFAVFKAEAAYVPLDPSYPQERLSFMLADAGISLLLTQEQLLPSVPALSIPTLALDALSGEEASFSSFSGPGKNVAHNAAYVIYTSGSTGDPKGVVIEQGAVSNFLMAMQDIFCLTPEDRFLAVTTLSFDIAVLELLLPLLNGACVILASRAVSVDGTQLAAMLTKEAATFMQATPSTWRLLLEAGWVGSKRTQLLCGGEALSPDLATQLQSRGAAVWNLYGPTETTIWSTIFAIPSQPGDRIPIGRPIANTQIYVLDAYLHPVPIGVPGELYIGGAGVARGYLRRPALTAERFVPHPWSRNQGERLYRTGDLVRYRRDGCLEYIGRIDSQVKVRGHRIELGEIESVLREHPLVQDAVAAVWEKSSHDARILAYVQPTHQHHPAGQELRDYLARKLPASMLPSAFILLDRFPLTPNGKVDRKRLPIPEDMRPALTTTYEPPRTDIEQMIATIWQQVLEIDRVGIHDNFFDLGGHSLLVIQVHTHLQAAGVHNVSVVDLFQYPTISDLARLIGRKQQAQSATQAIHERVRRQREALERQKTLRKGREHGVR